MKNEKILSTIFVYALLALFSMLISLNAHAAVGQVSSYIDMGPHVPGGIKIYPRPNSDYVYTLSRFDNSIKLWNVSSRRHEKSVYLASHEGSGLIGLCDDGNELIVAQHVFPGKLRLYRVDREKMVEVDFHELPIDAQLLTCASDGEFNFVAGKNKLFSINKKSFATKELYVGSSDIVSIDTSPTNQLAILEK
jgi:WD40 repeat protein